MSNFMNRALDLALENVKEGGTPYGAVLVIDNEIVSEGVNTMHKEPDIAGHAELIAIREAQKKLNRIDLSDAIIYASGHPCPMCLGSIALSGIKEVYFGNTYDEAAEAGMPLTQHIYQYLKNGKSDLKLKIVHNPIRDRNRDPMRQYVLKKRQELKQIK